MDSYKISISILGIVSTVVSLLLIFFLISKSSNKSLSNKLFALYLLLICLDLSSAYSHFFFNRPNNFFVFLITCSALTIPVLYLYVLSVCYSNFKMKLVHVIHTIPFVLINILLVFDYYGVNAQAKVNYLKSFENQFVIKFFYSAVTVLAFGYLFLIYRVLYRFKRLYYENYSNAELSTYRWLWQLINFTAILYFVATIKNSFKFLIKEDFYVITVFLVSVLLLVVNCWYVIKALKYPILFSGVNSNLQVVGNLDIEKKTSETNDDIKSLKHFMQTEEPFLDASLTLQKLASQLNMPSRELSVLINKYAGKHFFDFVNEYRVKKAKTMLLDTSKNKLTVLEILYEVGFNSKSSFNTAFKKYVGLTPTQFRKKHNP